MAGYILEEYKENLLKYFTLLRSVGGTHAIEPFRFLIIGFIDDIFNSEMSEWITEEDYKAIDRVVNCWMGTCLMPFHTWKSYKYIRCIPLKLENNEELYATEDFTNVLIEE